MKKLFVLLFLGLFLISFASATEIYWTQVGNGLNISSMSIYATITSLNSTRVAFIDRGNDQLRTYDWNGTDWNMFGNGLNIPDTSAYMSITSLNSTRVAFIDATNDQLRTYDWNGTDWNMFGNGLNIAGVGTPSITSLNSTRVAFIDALNSQLRTYDWNGTDWNMFGNGLNMTDTLTAPTITSLNSTRIAYRGGATNSQLKTYDWNGTDWNMFGNGLNIIGSGFASITSLSSSRIAYVDGTNDQLRTYDWNGTDWSQTGDSLSIINCGSPSITKLTSTKIAFVDGTNRQLRTYKLYEGEYPVVTLNSNTPNGLIYSGINMQLNITANSSDLDKVWYNYNGTNVFINGAKSGIYNLTNITITSNKTITIYANNTYGALTTSIFDLNYKVFYNSDTYVNTTHTGVTNTFTINITSPNISSIKLNYNGTNYTANSYSSGSDTIGTRNVAAPVFSTDKNVSFYWIFTMLDGSVVNNTPKNQTIKTINLGNTYSNLIYNISVKDEATGAVIPNINVSMSYEVTYGTTNTSIIGTNLFNDNGLANKNISSDVSIASGLYMYGNIVYTSPGYIGRTYSFSENNISSYKNITLYLSLATTSYVKTMYVTDEGGRGKAALFKQYTNINGTKTLIATEQLDSTGKTTIVFIPNIQYTFEFTNVGCLNLTKNIIFYDQTDYVQVLSCSSYNPDDWIDEFKDMFVSFSPNGLFYVDNDTEDDDSAFFANVSGSSEFCDSINTIVFNIYNSTGALIGSDTANGCDVLSDSAYFDLFARATLYILLDSGEEKTLGFRWQKLYSNKDYSGYNILDLLQEVGESEDILGIDWKFKLLFCFIGLFGIIIALTAYQRIYNFSNTATLIICDAYIWFMCFIGWGSLNFGKVGGGFTTFISQYALFILAVVGTVGVLSNKEDEYS